MNTANWILLLTSLSTSVGGLCLIYLSWKWRNKPVLMAAGWAGLSISLVLAVLANGDRGFAQVASVAMLLVSFFLIWKLSAQPVSLNFAETKRAASIEPTATNSWIALLSSVWTFLVTGPIAGAIAFLGAAGLFKLIRPEAGNPANAGVIAIIASILAWALVSTILLIESRPIRRTAYAFGGLVLTSLAAFI